MVQAISLERTSHDKFHSFCVRPDMEFDNQAPNEQVFLTLRAHPITFFTWIFNSMILFILLMVGNFFLPILNLSVIQIIFINIFALSAIVAYIWFNILLYIFNVGIVTNMQILDVDFIGIVYKEVSGARNEKVEQITNKTSGYFASYFNYGNIFVETAGEDINIEFLKIPRPAEAIRLMNEII